jgi:hypothetical protein
MLRRRDYIPCAVQPVAHEQKPPRAARRVAGGADDTPAVFQGAGPRVGAGRLERVRGGEEGVRKE